MAKTRVLLILHELSLSGAPKVALDLFEAFATDFEVQVFSMVDGPLRAQAGALGPLTNIQDMLNARTLPRRIMSKAKRARLQLLLQQWKPDVIYINSVVALNVLQLVDYTSAPVLLHVHELEGILRLSTRQNPSFFKERPTRYIAVSEAVQRALVEIFDIDTNRIEIIHECVPYSMAQAFVPATVKDSSTPFVIGGVGTPDMRKGITLWLQVAAELVAMVGSDKVRFRWVGIRDDYVSEMFRVMAHKLNLNDCVEFIPVTPHPLPHFAEFDVFAMTSWEDPCPIVVLEAMLLGKPVICFAGGGGAVEEIGDTGLAIADFSTRAMAEAIAELMQSPERCADMGRRARARVLENFVTTMQAPKIEREICALAKNKN